MGANYNSPHINFRPIELIHCSKIPIFMHKHRSRLPAAAIKTLKFIQLFGKNRFSARKAEIINGKALEKTMHKEP